MLTNHGVTYLKENEPIGCRDRYTLNLLRQRGIESWFTGCLTLTLGEKYTSVEKKENVYFVDPCIPTSQDRMARMARLVILLKHPILVHKNQKSYLPLEIIVVLDIDYPYHLNLFFFIQRYSQKNVWEMPYLLNMKANNIMGLMKKNCMRQKN